MSAAPHRWAEEAGAGSVTVLGTAALGAALLASVAAVGHAAVLDARASAAADLAALAASDARRGLSDHDPCELAARTAEANGARLEDCTIRADGGTTVTVHVSRAPFADAVAEAVAGPPEPRTSP